MGRLGAYEAFAAEVDRFLLATNRAILGECIELQISAYECE